MKRTGAAQVLFDFSAELLSPGICVSQCGLNV
jgi:hypothetical protein